MCTSSLNSFCHSWSTWQVLNSLDLDMVRLLTPMIKNWDADNDVKVIVLKGAGEKVKAPMPPRLAAALGSLLRTHCPPYSDFVGSATRCILAFADPPRPNHTPKPHTRARAHTHTHTRTHARTHARTHTHTIAGVLRGWRCRLRSQVWQGRERRWRVCTRLFPRRVHSGSHACKWAALHRSCFYRIASSWLTHHPLPPPSSSLPPPQACLSKPYVVFMDGITMGGGVGLSMPAPFRWARSAQNKRAILQRVDPCVQCSRISAWHGCAKCCCGHDVGPRHCLFCTPSYVSCLLQ
jgi:hypothetical protein